MSDVTESQETLDVEVRFVIPLDLIDENRPDDAELGADWVRFVNDKFEGEVMAGVQVHLAGVSRGMIL